MRLQIVPVGWRRRQNRHKRAHLAFTAVVFHCSGVVGLKMDFRLKTDFRLKLIIALNREFSHTCIHNMHARNCCVFGACVLLLLSSSAGKLTIVALFCYNLCIPVQMVPEGFCATRTECNNRGNCLNEESCACDARFTGFRCETGECLFVVSRATNYTIYPINPMQELTCFEMGTPSCDDFALLRTACQAINMSLPAGSSLPQACIFPDPGPVTIV